MKWKLKTFIFISLFIYISSINILLMELAKGHKIYHDIIKTHELKLNYLKEKVDYKLDFKSILLSNVLIFSQKGRGSGVIIDQNLKYFYVLTAKHVIEGAEKISVLKFDERIFEYKENGIDVVCQPIPIYKNDINLSSKYDLAYIRVPKINFENCNTIEIAKNEAEIGDTLYSVASISESLLNVNKGICSFNLAKEEFRFDCGAFKGSSGGCILNDHGELVGIISAISMPKDKNGNETALTFIGIGVQLDIIKDFITESEKILE